MLLFLDIWQQYTQFRPVLQVRPVGLGLEGLGDGLGGDADDLIRAKLGPDVPGLPCQFRPPVL